MIKKTLVLATLATLTIGNQAMAKSWKDEIDERREKRIANIRANQDSFLLCPNMEFGIINVCEDRKRGIVCYYEKSDPVIDTQLKRQPRTSISCIKNK